MLQSIRDHTHGWIAGVIITVIILSFALWGISSYFVGNTTNTVVAEVNGIEIGREQLTVAYERLRRQNQNNTAGLITNKEDAVLKKRALDALVNIEVLKQASIDQGFQISNRQVDGYLQSMPEFQVEGQFSLEKFQDILATTLLSTSEFLDLIRISLLIDQPKLGIVLTSFALPDETIYTIALVNQLRDIDYILLPLQYFLNQSIEIAPEKIKAYYEQNQKDFMTPEQVNVEYIELSMKDLAAKVNPTDAVLKNFYNENINSYTQPMAWKLVSIPVILPTTPSRDQVMAATDQAEKVINGIQSEKMATKTDNAIVYDWMILNQVPAELQKAVATLKQSGQVSELVKTDEGFVIIKALDIRPPRIQPFEASKDKVKETYVHQYGEEQFANLREQLTSLTYEHPDSLQYAAKAMGLSIKTSELFTKDKSGKDISQYKKVRDVAFSEDVLHAQNNSDALQLNPDTVVVLRLKSHIASTLLPLKDISKQIADKLKAQEAEVRAGKLAEELKTKLAAGTNPQQIAAAYKLTWNNTGYQGRYSTKVDSAILDTAFSLPNPEKMLGNIVYGVTRIPNGFAVVALKSIKPGKIADQKQEAVFSEQVQNSEGLLEYELYTNSNRAQSSIEVFQN